MNYQWDARKALTNRNKHGVDFVDSIVAIEDPNRLEETDEQFEYGEELVRVIGMAARGVLFVVTATRGEDTHRIISARRATRDEQDRYFADDRETW